MAPPAILLAGDHILVLEALKKLLEPQFNIVGTVSDETALLSVAQESRPDVVILDIGKPKSSSIEFGLKLKTLMPRTKLIALTMNEDAEVAREALKLWASGYLLKGSAGSELIKAIRETMQGRSYVSPKMVLRLRDEFIRAPTQANRKDLTPRQRQVLKLLANGMTMKETANALHVTARTVAFHKYRIMRDFGLNTNSDLVKFAIHEGVIAQP